METIPAEVITAFGLHPELRASAAGEDRALDDHIGRGFALLPSELSPAAVEDALASSTPVRSFAAFAARLGAPDAQIVRADRVPGLYLVVPEGLDVQAVGPVSTYEGATVVDARGTTVWVMLAGSGGDALLRFEGDVMQWFDLESDAPTALSGLEGWSPPPPVMLKAPPVEDLLGAFDAPSWLTAPLRTDGLIDAYSACAAVATVGRLWSPKGTATSPAAAMARARAGDDPHARAQRWFSAQTLPVKEAARDAAVIEADTLGDELEALVSTAAEDRELARLDAVRWLERRDDLASAAWLFREESLGEALTPGLASLDRLARTHATLWRALSPLRSPRLDEVAWQEPEAWWGRLR